MDRAGFLYGRFLERFGYEPTPCQDGLFRSLADFVTCDDADILVVNGYAGTGKTTAVAAAVGVLREMGAPSVLLAPTGRSAKVLSSVSGRPASTIHKHIYRQKSVSAEGCGSSLRGRRGLADRRRRHRRPFRQRKRRVRHRQSA